MPAVIKQYTLQYQSCALQCLDLSKDAICAGPNLGGCQQLANLGG